MSDIPMAQDFTFIRYRTITVADEDAEEVLQRIREIGTLDLEEPPWEDKFAMVQYYTLVNGNEAEVFWKDMEKKELGIIRVSVIYSEKDEYEFNRINGIRKKNTVDEAIADSNSNTLSPYMAQLFDKALGFE